MPRFDLAPYRPTALDDLVRLGRDNDGGYVISRRTVDAARVLVGLGINDDWSFEEAFVRANPRVRVVGVDGSVSAKIFRAPAGPHLRRVFGGLRRARRHVAVAAWAEARPHLARARSFSRFFDGRRHQFVQRFLEPTDGPTSVSWATLARRYDLAGGAGARDVFLKMDIEGAEYRTLGDVLPHADRIAGAAIEFHDLDRHWDEFAEFMEALARTFAVAHVHGNNNGPLVPGTATPAVLEVSLVNRGLLTAPPRPSPHAYPLDGLDMPNAAWLPDYPLAF